MQFNIFKILVLTFLIGLSSLAFGTEWYEKFSFKINDQFDLTMFHAVPGNERIMGTFRTGHRVVTAGQIYVIFSQAELQRIETAGNRKYIHYENILDSKKATFWKNTFAKRGVIVRIPSVVSIAGVIANRYFPTVGKAFTATTLFIDVLLASRDGVKKDARELSGIMSKGGKFTNYLTIQRNQNNHPFVHSDVFYQAKIAEEPKPRFYLIYSSVHAVKVE